MTDYKQLCADLLEAWDTAPTPSAFVDTNGYGTIQRIRAALAGSKSSEDMTDNDSHPITPSPFQLDQWEAKARATTDPPLLNEPAIRAGRFGVVHRKALCLAFASGADQELDACCKALKDMGLPTISDQLQTIRRPKPTSLKEQALAALEQVDEWAVASTSHFTIHNDLVAGVDTIRRALESMPEGQ